jgi:hypothetical protein
MPLRSRGLPLTDLCKLDLVTIPHQGMCDAVAATSHHDRPLVRDETTVSGLEMLRGVQAVFLSLI